MSTPSEGSGVRRAALPSWQLEVDRDDAMASHGAIYVGPDGRRVHMVAGSSAALEAAIRPLAAYLDAAGATEHQGEGTPETTGLSAEIRRAVTVLSELLAGHDSLDVLSMLRQYLVPPDLALWSEGGSQTSDSWACAEVVALVVLGRGLPRRSNPPIRTSAIIPDLVHGAARVLYLAALASMESRAEGVKQSASEAAVSDIAWRLRTYETAVRGRQYVSSAERINEATLRRPNADAVWRRVLGFTYTDVLAVRESLVDVLGAKQQVARDCVADTAAAGGAPNADVLEAMHSLLVTPSALYLVTAEQVATHAGLDPEVATRVLDVYSLGPDGRTPLDLVEEFVAGRNPMAGKGVIKAPGHGYLVLPGAVALDEIRRAAETLIAKDPAWVKYGKGRDAAAEVLVSDAFEELVHGRGRIHRQVRYRGTPPAGLAVDLSASSTDARQAESAEADALLVLDGVALCIEVKAGSIRKPSRQGRSTHLRRDLKETVQKAAGQADRLRALITTHHGLWLEDGTWLDLPDIHEVYSVVVTLDDLGPASLDTEALARSGVITQATLPWIVSVHDVLVIAELFDRPEQFLTYLRRRTSRDAALWVTAVDELDIVMWFVAGGFYFEPDPDRLHRDHPGGRPPTAKDRRTYANQGRTVVGTFTDPLDAWFYYREGSSSALVGRPMRDGNEFVRTIIDQMTEQGAPGWWRSGADLDGYSAHAQEDLSKYVLGMLSMSARDGQFHTYATGGTDDSGRWLFIFASGPDTAENREHLSLYLRAKKHQERADRAMAFFLRRDGKPRLTVWMPDPPLPDSALDQLAREMKLVPPDRTPRAVPPHAKPGAQPARRKRSKRRRR
ncbi:hypothetical protein [Cellulomonas shaoxiangyii]|uniref:Preprotein translocase subunit SecA n=1 Tax=Cellulomonas shaoxiangyii TaxID=2566013 RepID=A0A4P7SP34_9CELL|nr:hypothetical protein [Cellulomonas shaoxiangyii]QCB95036.1 hypothetical protein E5225_17170 [Cellulomonas shaoxiangyii]TGY86365.1 hypothetical protein E5226_02255 [Cellulomonas shaoxiangyii]